MTIFRDNAPRYWQEGLSVIPLMSSEKRPAIQSWQTFGKRISTPEEQQIWLTDYASCNIGLPTGVHSRIVMIDVDSKDPAVHAILDKILPASPWKRIGAKGYAMAYRHNGEENFNLRGIDGMILELLSTGRQLAIPPSIHPDTHRPYTANCELVDVAHMLPILPPSIDVILKAALEEYGIKAYAKGATKIAEFVPAGYRDSEMVAHAGIIARAVTRGTRTVLEGIHEMRHWVETYTEKVAGDPLDPDKAQGKFIEFLVRDVTHGHKALPPGWDTGLTDEDKENLGLVFAIDQELWSVERIQEFLLEEFQRHPEPSSSGFRSAVDIALSKVATNLEIKPLEERRILNFIANQGGNDNSLNTLRQELTERRKGDLAGTDHSEIARAVLDDLNQTGEVRFFGEHFWKWKGACWEILPDVEVRKHLQDYYGKLPAARYDSQHGQIVNACRTQAGKDLCQIGISALNFANGVLTEDLELLPHSPDYGMTYFLPYRYMPEEAGKSSIFFNFLQDCWGEDADYQEKVDSLQEMMAATMFGLAPKYQRAFCLYGASKTGKSRLIEIMRGLMPGGCTSNIAPADFGDKFLPAQMFGKLLNICGEISEHRKIDGDMFKKIVVGEEFTVQHKNGQPFDMAPKAAHWFASNHLPGTRDSSEGFTRRWVFLEFKHIIPDWKKIPDFDKVILNEEREQIAAWAIEGLARIKKNKEYTLPVSHMVLMDQVAEDNNAVRYFLSKGRQDGVLRTGKAAHEKRSENFVTATRLFQEFRVFSSRVLGATAASESIFRRRMNVELEEVFGFKKEFRDNPRHGKELVYLYLTLVSGEDM